MYGSGPLMVVVRNGGPPARAEAGRRPMQPASAGGAGGDGAPPLRSELQAGLAAGHGQGLDLPLIPLTEACDRNRLDPAGLAVLADPATTAAGCPVGVGT